MSAVSQMKLQLTGVLHRVSFPVHGRYSVVWREGAFGLSVSSQWKKKGLEAKTPPLNIASSAGRGGKPRQEAGSHRACKPGQNLGAKGWSRGMEAGHPRHKLSTDSR